MGTLGIDRAVKNWRQFVELSLDSSYFLGSFNLEMFLRMFLNFNNNKCIIDHTQSECVERTKFYMHSDI